MTDNLVTNTSQVKLNNNLALQDHITICICTFKRPNYLERLLAVLQTLPSDDRFTYSIVVVDNDRIRSAEDVVRSFKENSHVEIRYFPESIQNISLARNMAVRNSYGELIAFIDDDEFPDPKWLSTLYTAYRKYDAAGVLGPVKPHFENDPPSWIIKSKILERTLFESGTVIPHSKYTRTGNVLLRRDLFETEEDYFDPEFGLLGGSDVIFFKRMMKKNKKFVWCNEAIVYETVVPDRQKRLYYIKRAFTRGAGETRHLPFISISTLKSILAACLYTLALPFLLILNHSVFMKYLIKDCDHLGKLLAYCGIDVIKKRP